MWIGADSNIWFLMLRIELENSKVVLISMTSHSTERMAYLQRIIPLDHPYIQVVPIVQCTSRNHLQEFYQQLLKDRREGVMLRKPHSLYEKGRSRALLKYKVRK